MIIENKVKLLKVILPSILSLFIVNFILPCFCAFVILPTFPPPPAWVRDWENVKINDTEKLHYSFINFT